MPRNYKAEEELAYDLTEEELEQLLLEEEENWAYEEQWDDEVGPGSL